MTVRELITTLAGLDPAAQIVLAVDIDLPRGARRLSETAIYVHRKSGVGEVRKRDFDGAVEIVGSVSLVSAMCWDINESEKQ